MSRTTEDDEKLLAHLKQQVEDLQKKIAEEKRRDIRLALNAAKTSRSAYHVKKLLKNIEGLFPSDDVFRGSTADLLNEEVREGLDFTLMFVDKNKTISNGERYSDRFTFGPLSEHLSQLENLEREVQETQLIHQVNPEEEWNAGLQNILTLVTTTATTTTNQQPKFSKKRLLEEDPIDEDYDLELQLLDQLPAKKRTISNHQDKVKEQVHVQEQHKHPNQQAQEITFSWEETQPC